MADNNNQQTQQTLSLTTSAYGIMADRVAAWPQRYLKRFAKWFLHRHQIDIRIDAIADFENFIEENRTDVERHLKNWDNSLTKALMKDKAVNKTLRKVKNYVKKSKKTKENGKHPHDKDVYHQVINDVTFPMKVIVMCPKYRTISYLSYDQLPADFRQDFEEKVFEDYTHEMMEEQGDTGTTSTDLEVSGSVSSSTNITFVDERPVDSASLHTGNEVFSRDVHRDIAETDWSLQNILTREYPLNQFAWKVGDTISTKIVNVGLPKAITDDENCMITRQLQFFSFMRAGIKIRVQLNGTKFHCGRLIVYFKALTWDDDTEENFYSLTCWPHFFLDASVSNSGEIQIPFTHLLSYFSQEAKTCYNDSINALGSLIVRPYNPLQAAEKSSQALYGQVYLSLIDPYVHLPTYKIKEFSYGNGYMQGLESVLKRGAGTLINSGLGIADKFTGGLVTGAGNALCNLLGICDKPSDPMSANPIINRTVGPLAHGAGLDRSIRLGLSPVAQTNTSPEILGATDGDFDILKLCKIPCLLDQPEWTDAQPSATKLFDMLSVPTYLSSPQYEHNPTARYTIYQPTMLAYLSRAFCLWRGTFKVKIQVVATQFHSGRLAIIYDPHGNQNNDLKTLEENKSHNMIIMDIQEQQELVIELPYFAVRPWMRCDRFRSDANLNGKSGIVNPSYLDCEATGVFRIFVLNTLVRPDNVTDKVQINVFFYAGDNFEVTTVNPITPLSVRTGNQGVNYGNLPRYPWCKATGNIICEFQREIDDLYMTGTRLFNKKEIKAGTNWYTPTIVMNTYDSVCFALSTKKLSYYISGGEGPCVDYVKGLPNYGATSVVEKIDTIDSTTKGTLTKVDDPLIQQSSATYQNVLTLMGDLRELKVTANQTNNTVISTEGSVGLINQDMLRVKEVYQQVGTGDVPSGTIMYEQGAESYTTTRDSEGSVITITAGNEKASVAPNTTSENAMNIQTLLRRYYPLMVTGDLSNSSGFTIFTIPVSPSFSPDDTAFETVSQINRRYDVHNLAWIARLFTFWRGSMRYKIVANADNSDIYVWHNPVEAKNFHIASGFSYQHVTDQLNFAAELAISRVQQGIEVEVPFYSGFNQLMHSHVSTKADLRAQNGTLFIAVRNRTNIYNVSIFVSTGDDFWLNVLRPPPVVHEFEAQPYVDSVPADLIRYPELQRSMTHECSNVQIPGGYVFDRYSSGSFGLCDIPEAPAQDFSKNQLVIDNQQMEEQGLFDLGAEVDKIRDDFSPVLDDSRSTMSEIRVTMKEIRDSVLPQLLGHVKMSSGSFNQVNQDLSSVVPKIEQLVNKLDSFVGKGTQMAGSATNMMNSFSEATSFVSWTVKSVIVGGIWINVVKMFNQPTFVGLINIACLLCALFSVNVGSIIQWLYANLFEDSQSKVTNGAMEEQGLEEIFVEYSEKITVVLAVVATVLYAALFGSLPAWSTVKKGVKATVEGDEMEEQGLGEFLRSVHFANLGCKALSNAFEFFNKWITKIINWFLGKEAAEVAIEKQFKERAAQIEKWIDDIAALEDEDMYHLALSDIDCHNKFYRLAEQGTEFTKWLMKDGVSKNVSSIIRDANKRLYDMIKRINTMRPGHGIRYSPFVVMMDGESSIAKSSVMHKFTDVFREELKIPYYHSCYAVPTAAKYLDGYQGQAIIEWDDILQCPEQDLLVAEFINWRSNADCIINKAHVDEKGMHFVSKAITMSTNNGGVNIKQIRDMNAFRNRLNVKFHCYLAEGWTVRRIKQLPQRDPNFGFLLFDAYHTNENGSGFDLVREGMTLAQALDFTREDFKQWDQKQKSIIDDYMETHGSLRIPKGIHIAVDDDIFVDAQEQGKSVSYIINKAANLSEEDDIEAELFQIHFNELPDEGKESFYQMSLRQTVKTAKKSKKYYELLKRKLKLGVQSFMNKIKDIYSKYPTLCKALGVVSMIGASSLLIGSVWNMFSAEEKTEESAYETIVKMPSRQIVKAEGAYETGVSKIAPKIVKAEGAYEVGVGKTTTKLVKAEGSPYTNVETKSSTKLVVAEAQEEGTADVAALEMARNKIHPLLSTVGWEKSEGKCVLQALAVGGKVIMTPHHFFRRAKDGDIFFYVRGTDKILVEFATSHLFRIRDKDCCLYYVGATFDSRKNIVDCFVSEKHLGLIPTTRAVLVGISASGTEMEKSCIVKGNVEMTYSGKDEKAIVYKQFGWSYDMDTLVGECGSVLIALNKNLPPPSKIIGMHTAGYATKTGGFSIVITKEMVQETLNQVVARFGQLVYGAALPNVVNQDPIAFEEQCKIVPEGHFSFYGVMDPKFCPSQPKKTSLRPTPMHAEIYPVVKKPASLVTVNGVSPLRKALAKYGKLTTSFSKKHIKIVQADMTNELSSLVGDLVPEPTSISDAIFGKEGIAYCEKMNMQSSPGWPYQCLPRHRGKVGKGYLFDDEKKEIVDPLLNEKLIERENCAKQGMRVPSIWRDCMKDELRPIAKVDAGKTRLFNIAPVDFTILVRKYFLAFEQMFYKNHTKFFSAVGINPESFEWTESYNRLRSYGQNCIAGDFGSFDGTLMADLIYAVGEVIDDWYKLQGEKDEHASIVRKVLIDEMIHTMQLVQNCVYKTHCGNPSGNPLTVIINTMVNAMYMRLAWMEIMSENAPHLATMHDYHNNVLEEMYGDDNRLVIKKPMLEFYNQVSITSCLAKHGLEYTDECKSSNIVPYRNLKETTFLKRAYRWDEEVGNEIALPVMDVDTLTSLTNWYRESNDVEEQLQSNMKAALDFAFFHGREFYDEFHKKFSDSMRKHAMHPICITFDEQLDRFLAIVHGTTKPEFKFMNLGF